MNKEYLLREIEKTLNNLENVKVSNKIKAEVILNTIIPQLVFSKPEEKNND